MKRLNKLFTIAGIAVAVVLMGAATVQAAKPPTSHKIFIEGTNQTPDWMIRVDVDHPDRVYKVDTDPKKSDVMKVTVVSESDGYLYLFNVDPEGAITCIFPNKIQPNNQIKAKQEVNVGDGKQLVLRVGAPTGKELIKAIVTKEPLKSADPDKLIDSNKPQPREISEDLARHIIIEAITGDAKLADSGDTIEKIRDAFKDKHPAEFKKRSQEYAEHQIEITSSNAPAKQVEKRVGLFIGVSDFMDKSIRPLKTAHKDAQAMADIMKKEGPGQFDQTYVLTNKDATLSNIKSYICEKLVQETHPGDTVMIFWSGHGGRCASLDGKAFDQFLVPYDGSLDTNDSVRRTMLLDKTMARWVQDLDGRKVMVVLDTCHSGGFGALSKGLTEDYKKFIKGVDVKGNADLPADKWNQRHFLADEMARAKGIGQKDAAVLASSTAKQVSFECRDKEFSVMTYYIVDFVKNSKKALTLEDVYNGVKDKVNDYVKDKFDGTEQTPVFSDQTVVPPAKVKP